MSFNEHKKCPMCKAVYLNGNEHSCHNDDVTKARLKLEAWLGDWTIEGE